MKELVLIADNIRSTHNVGSLLRTCDALGVKKLYLCGITPHGNIGKDEQRLPHIITKIEKDIHKTALGAEATVDWEYVSSTSEVITRLKNDGYEVVALEQDAKSVNLHSFKPPTKTALLVGPEVTGMSQEVLKQCDVIIEIPMHGQKESLNVSVAAGIALYTLAQSH